MREAQRPRRPIIAGIRRLAHPSERRRCGYNPGPERTVPARARILFPMHVLFEDDGHLKAGTVLADNEASLQVEAASGKRLKVKAAAVLLRFADPSPSALQAEAQTLARELDPNFLWEVSADDEFGFADLAREYYGRAPAPPEAAAVAVALASAPMYFYKRGKGRYRKAPPDALKAALASVERKRREGEQMAAWVDELRAHRLPDALRAKLPMLLYAPDKNALEWKALAAACDSAQTNPVALLAQCGAIPSSHDYHYNGFLAQAFPKGIAFPASGELPALPDLPRADVRAFSIDDHTTTEIDDAFSVRELGNGHHEIGIHIAAPALAVARGSPLDALARERLSTVYMPGRKITMLPDAAIAAFTLAEGAARPALSLYAEITADGTLVRHETRVNRVPVAANLRLDAIGDAFANALPSPSDPEWSAELRMLWRFAQAQAAGRGKADVARIDYSFYVDWEAAPDGRVAIVPRPRGSPLDRVVSELMIFVNRTWGEAARPRARRGAVSHAVERQGEDEYAPGRASGARSCRTTCGRARRCAAIRISSTSGSSSRSSRARSRRTPRTTPSSTRRSSTSRRPTRATPSSRTGWSTTGACAGCCRRASPRRRPP